MNEFKSVTTVKSSSGLNAAMDGFSKLMDQFGELMNHAFHSKEFTEDLKVESHTETVKVRVTLGQEQMNRLLAGNSVAFKTGSIDIEIKR